MLYFVMGSEKISILLVGYNIKDPHFGQKTPWIVSKFVGETFGEAKARSYQPAMTSTLLRILQFSE